MADKAVLMCETELPIQFSVADSTAIEKGDLLEFTNKMVVTKAVGDEQIFAGIAAEEKAANNGQVRIGVYRGGLFAVLGEGAITVGDSLSTGEATGTDNAVQKATATSVSSATIGAAMETAADGNTLLIELRPGFNNAAYA